MTAEDLWRYFADRLPARIAEIEAAHDAALRSGWTGEPLRTFHRLAHSLAGAGATFGFSEVTAASKRLEALLKDTLGGGPPPADAEVAELLARLRAPGRRPPEASAGVAPEPTPESVGAEGLLYLGSDDPAFRESLTSQLGPFGYEVRAFADPAALEREVARRPPAAVILDWKDSGGRLTSFRQVRGAAPKTVFLSTRGDLPSRLEAVRAGGDAYLTKPVEAGLLAETLDRLTGTGNRYRVLIVEDDADLATLYARALEAADMMVDVVSDPMAVMAPLTHLQPDLILMDLYMPGCTGPELAAVLRQQDGYVGTPIVFLSAEEELEKQIAAINAGGDEFLTKPIDPGHLVEAVKARARRGRLLASRISYDGLTGLLNHSHLKQQIEVELSRAGREGRPVAYAMIDVDRFKSINDAFGHTSGDRLLKSLARLLRQRLRRSDVLGRYGGDELAVLLPHTDGPTARRVLDEIRDSFSRLRLLAGGREMSATLSCGVAVYPARRTAQELVEAADAALYEAKGGGRNRVVLRD
jgi:diguanylate cyclase (GGDEF)-like protein